MKTKNTLFSEVVINDTEGEQADTAVNEENDDKVDEVETENVLGSAEAADIETADSSENDVAAEVDPEEEKGWFSGWFGSGSGDAADVEEVKPDETVSAEVEGNG